MFKNIFLIRFSEH